MPIVSYAIFASSAGFAVGTLNFSTQIEELATVTNLPLQNFPELLAGTFQNFWQELHRSLLHTSPPGIPQLSAVSPLPLHQSKISHQFSELLLLLVFKDFTELDRTCRNFR